MNTPRISIIAAIGENGELGKNDDLIWRISDDLKRLKTLTTGHPLIMGRATYESIGRPLPDRTNIVITSNPSYSATGCQIVHSLGEAIKIAKASSGAEEIFIFGGARVYVEALPQVDRLYLTRIHDTDAEADVFFPPYDDFSKVVKREAREQDDLRFEWVTLERG